MVILVTLISLVSSALSTILGLLYLYAAEGTVPGQFDADLLEGAFQAK